MDKDKIEHAKEFYRQIALAMVTSWVNRALEDHVEPQRAGVQRGSKIGPTKRKQAGALFSVAYSQRNLNLREIAKLAGTTEATVKVWRTQDDFLQACNNAANEFSTSLTNTLEMAVTLPNDTETIETNPHFKVLSDFEIGSSPFDLAKQLMYMLPTFATMVEDHVVKFLAEKIKDQSIEEPEKQKYIILTQRFMKSFRAFNESDARQLAIDSLQVTTKLISSTLDFLIDPERWTPENRDKSKEYLAQFKEMIFDQLDSLAGRKIEANTLTSQRMVLKELYLQTLPARELIKLAETA